LDDICHGIDGGFIRMANVKLCTAGQAEKTIVTIDYNECLFVSGWGRITRIINVTPTFNL